MNGPGNGRFGTCITTVARDIVTALPCFLVMRL